jgi:sarcosine/dimethylglycine N-methyltransferase
VLDAGTGIGGTARFVAGQYGWQVTTIDLTEEYCKTVRWLNGLVGLAGKIFAGQADVTRLPFSDAALDIVFSQHVQMNVADKARLYAEARRVLAADGRLAICGITAGAPGELGYPLPWANQPDRSHLAAPAGLRAMIESASFAVDQWNDLTDQAAALMRAVMARPPDPWACTPSFLTSPRRRETSPGPWPAAAFTSSRRSR